MICPNCKKTLPSDSSVCGFCGYHIKDTLNNESKNDTTNTHDKTTPLVETPKPNNTVNNSKIENIETTNIINDKSEDKPSQKVVKSAAFSTVGAISKAVDKSKKIINKNPFENEVKKTKKNNIKNQTQTITEKKAAKVSATPQTNTQQNNITKQTSFVSQIPSETKEEAEKRQILQTTMIINEQEKKKFSIPPEKFYRKYKPVSTAGFFFTELLLCIPLLNIILLFVWAFRGNSNSNRKAFARSILIWMAITFILIFIVVILCLTVFSQSHFINSIYYSITRFISNYYA